jgi:hypothetical protein
MFLENVQPCYRQFYKKVNGGVQWEYYTYQTIQQMIFYPMHYFMVWVVWRI